MPGVEGNDMKTPCSFALTILLVAATAAAQLSAGTSRGSKVKADDPVVVQVAEALRSRKAFEADYLEVVNLKTEQQKAQMTKRYAQFVKRIREDLEPKTKFIYQEGLKVTLAGGAPGMMPLMYPMKGETPEQPSMFRFPPGKNKHVYVVFSYVNTRGVELSLHLLMWKIEGIWRAIDVALWPRKSHGVDFEKAFGEAKKQFAAKSYALTVGLCEVAAALSRGPNYRLTGQQQKLRALYGQLARQVGRPPKVPLDKVTTGDGVVEITGARAVLLKDGAYLCIVHRAPRGKSKEDAEARQKRIASALLKKRPVSRKYFVGVIVTTGYTDPTDTEKAHTQKYPISDLVGPKARMGPVSRPAMAPSRAVPVPKGAAVQA